MNEKILNYLTNIRLTEPVFTQLKEIAAQQKVKVADLILKAICEVYGLPNVSQSPNFQELQLTQRRKNNVIAASLLISLKTPVYLPDENKS